MDLGLLLFGVIGMAYGLISDSKTETKSKTETPKLPDLPEGCHYEFIDIGKNKTSYIVPMVVPNKKEE